MPSRTEFLAGLAPASHAPDPDCSISYGPLQDPVQLPCDHIFDRDCTESWLNGFGHNTCPACRRILFDLPQEELLEEDEAEDGDDEADEDQQLQVRLAEAGSQADRAMLRAALRRSGLQTDRSEQPSRLYNFRMDSFSQLDTYNASVTIAQDLSRSIGETEEGELILDVPGGDSEIVRGMVYMHFTTTLGARLIAFAYLIPSTAFGGGLPYTEQNLLDWQIMLKYLVNILVSQHRATRDAHSLANDLRDMITQRLAEHGQGMQTPLLLSHEDMGGMNRFRMDLDTVLDYVCYFFWRKHQDREQWRHAAAEEVQT